MTGVGADTGVIEAWLRLPLETGRSNAEGESTLVLGEPSSRGREMGSSMGVALKVQGLRVIEAGGENGA